MKKMWSCLMIGCCIIILVACGIDSSIKDTSSKYCSYVVNMANDGIIKNVEKNWWFDSNVEGDSIEKKKTATWAGVEYTGEYSKSRYSNYSHVRKDYYENDETILSFYADDGEFEGIHYKSILTTDYYYQDDIENAYEYACSTAKEIASQYIDVEAYRLEEHISESVHSKAEGEKVILYTFKYVKYLGEFPTTDTFYVQITSKGDLRTMHIGHIGGFDNVDVSKIEKEELDKALDNKLKELYSNIQDNSNIQSYSYNVLKQTMAYTPENDLAIVSEVEVEIMLEDGSGYETAVSLATVVSDID